MYWHMLYWMHLCRTVWEFSSFTAPHLSLAIFKSCGDRDCSHSCLENDLACVACWDCSTIWFLVSLPGSLGDGDCSQVWFRFGSDFLGFWYALVLSYPFVCSIRWEPAHTLSLDWFFISLSMVSSSFVKVGVSEYVIVLISPSTALWHVFIFTDTSFTLIHHYW